MFTMFLDVGNTNTGFFYNNTLNSKLNSIPTEEIYSETLIKDFIQKHNTSKIFIASVVPIVSILFESACQKNGVEFKNILFEDIPIQTTLESNAELGIDRAINAFYGMEKFGKNVVIIDFGTALTFDVVHDGIYQGGMIFPGITMAMHNLHTKTAKLPSVKITEFRSGIGKNTIDAIIFGSSIGYEGVLKNTIKYINHFYQTPFKIVFTGGSGKIFHHLIKDSVFEENLILEYLIGKYSG